MWLQDQFLFSFVDASFCWWLSFDIFMGSQILKVRLACVWISGILLYFQLNVLQKVLGGSTSRTLPFGQATTTHSIAVQRLAPASPHNHSAQRPHPSQPATTGPHILYQKCSEGPYSTRPTSCNQSCMMGSFYFVNIFNQNNRERSFVQNSK